MIFNNQRNKNIIILIGVICSIFSRIAFSSDDSLRRPGQEGPTGMAGIELPIELIEAFDSEGLLRAESREEKNAAGRYVEHVSSIVMMIGALTVSAGFNEYVESVRLLEQREPSFMEKVSYVSEALYTNLFDVEFMGMLHGAIVAEGIVGTAKSAGSEVLPKVAEETQRAWVNMIMSTAGRFGLATLVTHLLHTAYTFAYWEFFGEWIHLGMHETEVQLMGSDLEVNWEEFHNITYLFIARPDIGKIFLKNMVSIVAKSETRRLLVYNTWRRGIFTGDFAVLVSCLVLSGIAIDKVFPLNKAKTSVVWGLKVTKADKRLLRRIFSGYYGFTLLDKVPESSILSLDYLLKGYRSFKHDKKYYHNNQEIEAYLYDLVSGNDKKRAKENLKETIEKRKRIREKAISPTIELYAQLTRTVAMLKSEINAREYIKKHKLSKTSKTLLEKYIDFEKEAFAFILKNNPVSSPFYKAHSMLFPIIQETGIFEDFGLSPDEQKVYYDLCEELSDLKKSLKKYLISISALEQGMIQGYFDEEMFLSGLIGKQRDYIQDERFNPYQEISKYGLTSKLGERFTSFAKMYEEEALECEVRVDEISALLLDEEREDWFLQPEKINFLPDKNNSCLEDLFAKILDGKVRYDEDLNEFRFSIAEARHMASVARSSVTLIPKISGSNNGLAFRFWKVKAFIQEDENKDLLDFLNDNIQDIRNYYATFKLLFRQNHERIRITDKYEKIHQEAMLAEMAAIKEDFEKLDYKEKQEAKMAIYGDILTRYAPSEEEEKLEWQVNQIFTKFDLLGYREAILDPSELDLIDKMQDNINEGLIVKNYEKPDKKNYVTVSDKQNMGNMDLWYHLDAYMDYLQSPEKVVEFRDGLLEKFKQEEHIAFFYGIEDLIKRMKHKLIKKDEDGKFKFQIENVRFAGIGWKNLIRDSESLDTFASLESYYNENEKLFISSPLLQATYFSISQKALTDGVTIIPSFAQMILESPVKLGEMNTLQLRLDINSEKYKEYIVSLIETTKNLPPLDLFYILNAVENNLPGYIQSPDFLNFLDKTEFFKESLRIIGSLVYGGVESPMNVLMDAYSLYNLFFVEGA
ncbi:MAG: hypothetical protein ABIA04_13175 [Pseudomonadota bacterium]